VIFDDPQTVAAFTYQALRMKAGVSEQIVEFFPAEGESDLVLSGFVFRPASDEDLDEGEELESEDFYTFEAHFYAEDHPMIGAVSTRLLLEIPGVGYAGAVAFFREQIEKARSAEG